MGRDDNFDDEIQSHLNMAIQDRIARGQSPEQARAGALREFGNVGLVKETTRAVWVSTAFEQLGQDLRSATRILTKSPWLSAAAIALVALGIGWNTTIYSMIHGILTKPAPGIHADRLVAFGMTTHGEMGEPESSFPDYLDYVAQTKAFGSILAFQFEPLTLVLKDASYRLHGAAVTTNYFETLQVPIIKGRPFRDSEPGMVAVIAYPLWKNQFRGAEDIVGQTFLVNGIGVTVIGVAAPGFRGTWLTADLDFWFPISSYAGIPSVARDLNDRSHRSLGIIGRLAPGASLAQAQAELNTISKRLQASFPVTNKDMMAVIAPYSATAFSPMGGRQGRLFMAIVTAVTLITLLIVCANVANLMLARAVIRQRELAVRQSIGASRFRSANASGGRLGAFTRGVADCLDLRVLGIASRCEIDSTQQPRRPSADRLPARLAGGGLCDGSCRFQHTGVYSGPGRTRLEAGTAALVESGRTQRVAGPFQARECPGDRATRAVYGAADQCGPGLPISIGGLQPGSRFHEGSSASGIARHQGSGNREGAEYRVAGAHADALAAGAGSGVRILRVGPAATLRMAGTGASHWFGKNNLRGRELRRPGLSADPGRAKCSGPRH
jgi:hypothetical protein